MAEFRSLTTSEQIAAHLRAEMTSGKIRGLMPGVLRLETELGVNRKTVQTAMLQLEKEGLLLAQGAGRRRLIQMHQPLAPPSLRVAILAGEPADLKLDYLIELDHKLGKAGFTPVYPPKCMDDLRMDLGRIARMVTHTEADAWVVMAAPREVLEWFAGQSLPSIAMFGRRRGLPIAAVGPDKRPAYAALTRKLIEMGHRRIVLLARTRRRLPEPGAVEQVFLDELAAHGLPVNKYNLPDWDDTVAGFHRRLESLFQITPPTALIVDEAPHFNAVLHFCAMRGIRVPDDISLISTDADPAFAWCKPPISHIHWDSRPVVRRILRWAENVSRGKEDLRQTLTPAEFLPGGTIGPAPR